MAKLIPADKKRCQAESRPPHGPFNLGPPEPMRRCKAKPKFIAKEKKKGPDGKRGSMSLCADCLAVLLKQMPDAADIVSIKAQP